jgi:prepilin-type N-terminal cleavage/methylation domain-containing protein
VPGRTLLSRTASEESGFTLLEVLVVTIIIGLLAAIAYATFLGQRTKAGDADAKDSASNMGLQIQSCHATAGDYTACDEYTDDELGDTGLPVDTGATRTGDCSLALPADVIAADPPDEGKVGVIASESDCYVVWATSVDGHFFWQRVTASGGPERGCTPPGEGGCAVGGTWNKGD